LLPPVLFFPHGEGRRAVLRGTGSSTQKKTPTGDGRGRHRHAAAPFPRKDVSALCRAGLLARGVSLLSAPSQGKTPQWSQQISIRLQLRGSDGFAPSSLVTVVDCDQPYQRLMQFYLGAYGSTREFVKDIPAESGDINPGRVKHRVREAPLGLGCRQLIALHGPAWCNGAKVGGPCQAVC
jgi:hypothetical protein